MGWARIKETRNAYRILVEKFLGKCILGRPRRGWEDNIKMDIKVTSCVGCAQNHIQWWTLKLMLLNLQVLLP
jgi:hypothetical protein